MDDLFIEIRGYHRISDKRENFSFAHNYCILVHNKTKLKTINMQTFFDEMWYIVEYFIVNIFSFLVVFDWGKSKTRIIFIHHA